MVVGGVRPPAPATLKLTRSNATLKTGKRAAKPLVKVNSFWFHPPCLRSGLTFPTSRGGSR